MSGEFIKLVHQCDQPKPEKQGLGSIWKCQCDKEWTSSYDRDLGLYWFWSNRPPVIYKTSPTKLQSLIALIKGEQTDHLGEAIRATAWAYTEGERPNPLIKGENK